MAKSTLYRYNPRSKTNEVVGNSDIAIRTHMLESFLKKNRVKMNYSRGNKKNLSSGRIENSARDYIVKVKCIVES